MQELHLSNERFSLKTKSLLDSNVTITHVDASALRALAQYGAVSGPIFPNITTLYLEPEPFGYIMYPGDVHDLIAEIFQQHITPGLITLHANLPFSILNVAPWMRIVRNLEGSNVETLTLSLSVDDDASENEFNAACTRAVLGLGCLRSLELTSLCPPTEIKRLAMFSHLSILNLSQILDSSMLQRVEGFPTLRDLSIRVKRLADLNVFVLTITSAFVQCIRCDCKSSPWAKELQEAISIIVRHNSRGVLSVFTISTEDELEGRDPQFLDFVDTYGPLQALPQLREFTMPYNSIKLLDDIAFVSFLDCLPMLEKLKVGGAIPVSLPTFRRTLLHFPHNDLPVILRPDFWLVDCDSSTTFEATSIYFGDVPEDPSIEALAQGLLGQFPEVTTFNHVTVPNEAEDPSLELRGFILSMAM